MSNSSLIGVGDRAPSTAHHKTASAVFSAEHNGRRRLAGTIGRSLTTAEQKPIKSRRVLMNADDVAAFIDANALVEMARNALVRRSLLREKPWASRLAPCTAQQRNRPRQCRG